MISVIPDGPIAPFIYLIVIIHLSFFNNKSKFALIMHFVQKLLKELRFSVKKLQFKKLINMDNS